MCAGNQVSMGAAANMYVEPWGAMAVGVCAAIVSVVGYRYLLDIIEKKGIHDTCGISTDATGVTFYFLSCLWLFVVLMWWMGHLFNSQFLIFLGVLICWVDVVFFYPPHSPFGVLQTTFTACRAFSAAWFPSWRPP